MALGILWVPRAFGNFGDYYDGYSIYNYGSARNNVKYDMVVGPYLGEPATISSWKNACRPMDVYVAIFSVGFTEYWLFKNAICSAFDQASGYITLVCSTCNVRRIQALPDCIHSLSSLHSRGIELAHARRMIYGESPEKRPTDDFKKKMNQMPGLLNANDTFYYDFYS